MRYRLNGCGRERQIKSNGLKRGVLMHREREREMASNAYYSERERERWRDSDIDGY